ncbi:SRPBCC family protein [Mycolicibacterium austroafricanum]|uniref:SRPBCC family protein n=1 Tax=Mycolicibacterium austroafricanum TaxID=39687 RepID=A0ABT8H658_MYCAO|nr:SRPBCC family protein [Mycolicibacterium austroafricanum]MDN4516244.1 SRPBCC family protein [Mycolicibacterium austroafricanum]QRZ08946.1 SRPBCC family protein [Mycolicibacterium austroafricanum]QZT70721.1 SRPBCC family protein [Mycolicibacterium austroafricanum]
MAKLELSRSLPIPAERAWHHAADLSTLGEWMSMHQGWRSELPHELGVGATVVGVAGAKGMRNRVTWTVRRFDPPAALEISGEGVGGTRYKLAMKVASAGDGCTFTVRMDLGGAPLFGPIGVAAVRAVKGDIDKSIERFEQLYA